jgi:hypothetical protein
MDVTDCDGVSLRVRGDGHVYSVQLYSVDMLRSEFAHASPLCTVKGVWKTYCIPFSMFERVNEPSTYLNWTPNTKRISRVALSISSSKVEAVPFELQLKCISFYKKADRRTKQRIIL